MMRKTLEVKVGLVHNFPHAKPIIEILSSTYDMMDDDSTNPI